MLFHPDFHKLAMDVYTIYAFYLVYTFCRKMWNRFRDWDRREKERQWTKMSSYPSHSTR